MVHKGRTDLCQNPFRKRKCGRPDVVALIQVKEKVYPICARCWMGIKKSGKDGLGESNWQWGDWGKKEYDEDDEKKTGN